MQLGKDRDYKLNQEPKGSFFLTIKRALLCPPTYFSIDYVINPWMKPRSVDKTMALKQWKKLASTLRKLDIKIETIKPQKGLPDMVFSADQGVVKNKKLVLSNFRYQERRGETDLYRKWFEKRGFNISTLPKKYFFEGSGECIWYKKTLFIGTGFRNSPGVYRLISKYLDTEAIYLELVNPRFYHLDTAFFPLNNSVAFYYPPAFSPKSIKILKDKIDHLVTFTDEEAYNFAANSLVTDHHVITQKGNKSFAQKLQNFGYKTISLDVSEFMKSGGGIHCLVQTLEKEHE